MRLLAADISAWDGVFVSVYVLVAWLLLFIAVLLYPFPCGVIRWPLKAGIGLVVACAATDSLLHVIGGNPMDYQPFTDEVQAEVFRVIGAVVGLWVMPAYGLVAYGSWLVGRTMGRVARERNWGGGGE